MFHSDISGNRRSTKVMYGPGGKSQMSGLIFGGGYDAENVKPIKKQENVSAEPIKPDASIKAGKINARNDRDIHSRPSTRVLNAPGGNSQMSSFLFSGYTNDNEDAAAKNKAKQTPKKAPWDRDDINKNQGKQTFANKGKETTQNQDMPSARKLFKHGVNSETEQVISTEGKQHFQGKMRSFTESKQFASNGRKHFEQPAEQIEIAHIHANKRSSTRVLQRPGGNSTFSLY